MKILLLCDVESAAGGNPRGVLENALLGAGHEVDVVELDYYEFKPCLGCFGCWVKTPGRCVICNDGANAIAEAQMRSDAVVILTRITFGGYSADVKIYLDRAIQNMQADFEVYKREMRHKMRYTRFPIWIGIGYGEAGDAERRTFSDLIWRNSLNMRPAEFLALTPGGGDPYETMALPVLELLEARV